MRIKNRKAGFWQDHLGELILAIIVLVIIFVGLYYLSKNGVINVNFIKNLFRF